MKYQGRRNDGCQNCIGNGIGVVGITKARNYTEIESIRVVGMTEVQNYIEIENIRVVEMGEDQSCNKNKCKNYGFRNDESSKLHIKERYRGREHFRHRNSKDMDL